MLVRLPALRPRLQMAMGQPDVARVPVRVRRPISRAVPPPVARAGRAAQTVGGWHGLRAVRRLVPGAFQERLQHACGLPATAESAAALERRDRPHFSDIL